MLAVLSVREVIRERFSGPECHILCWWGSKNPGFQVRIVTERAFRGW